MRRSAASKVSASARVSTGSESCVYGVFTPYTDSGICPIIVCAVDVNRILGSHVGIQQTRVRIVNWKLTIEHTGYFLKNASQLQSDF
jgi:hypothetical protein